MNLIYLYSFISILVVSLISLIGIFSITIKEKNISFFISLAVGGLLGDAFIHLISEAFHTSSNTEMTGLFVILGILIFFILEKFLHWHHHGEDTEKNHIHPMGRLILVSDGVHNFIDGIIIGASFLISIPVGIATTLAVILHEIPQEIGDYAVLLQSGYKKSQALWLNFISALIAFLGLALVFIIGENSEKIINFILPIAGGGFIYIAMSDLIPELQKEKNSKTSGIQFMIVVLGIALMLFLTLFE